MWLELNVFSDDAFDLTTLTCHLCYFDGMIVFFSCPLLLYSTVSSADFIHVSCRRSNVYLVLVSWLPLPAAAQMAAKPSLRSRGLSSLPRQPERRWKGGEKITMLIVLRHETDCANLWKMANQYLSFTDLIKQHYKVNTFL